MPKAVEGMVHGNGVLKYWVLGPSGHGRCLGLKGVPISLLWGLGRYDNDTWTLWARAPCRRMVCIYIYTQAS